MTEHKETTENRELMRQVRELGVIKAPSSLQQKLLAIPDEHPLERNAQEKSPFKQLYGRIASAGLAAAAVILIYSHLPNKGGHPDDAHLQETHFSQQEVLEAKQELAVAFHYLSEVSLHTSDELNLRVTHSSTQAIYKGVISPLTEEHTDE